MAIKQKLQDKRQSLYDWAGGKGSICNTEITPRGLAGVVGAVIIATGLFGCRTNHSQYKFDEKIREDNVTFIERKYLYPFDDDNILTEVKPDGRFIQYFDTKKEDLKLEYVTIAKDGETIRYTTADKEVLEEAQKNFDSRLKQILEINTGKMQKIKDDRIKGGLENLK